MSFFGRGKFVVVQLYTTSAFNLCYTVDFIFCCSVLLKFVWLNSTPIILVYNDDDDDGNNNFVFAPVVRVIIIIIVIICWSFNTILYSMTAFILFIHQLFHVLLPWIFNPFFHLQSLYPVLLSDTLTPLYPVFCVKSSEPCCSRMFVPMFVCLSWHDLQPTTIDWSQPNLVCRYIPVLRPV